MHAYNCLQLPQVWWLFHITTYHYSIGSNRYYSCLPYRSVSAYIVLYLHWLAHGVLRGMVWYALVLYFIGMTDPTLSAAFVGS